MRIIRQRAQNPIEYDSTAQDLIESVAQERCPQCWNRRPVGDVVTESDGVRRCPDCLMIRTDVDIARIEGEDAARAGMRQTRPQISRVALDDATPPHIRTMVDGSSVTVRPQSAPLVLTRGGAAKTLVLTGGDFASDDTFSYSSGISDNSAPSLSGTTVWTLSLVASGGATTGYKDLTFEDHIYKNIFLVV